MLDRRTAGFTLIEMMVALAVFSLAGLALIRLEGATIRSAAILDNTMMAQIVARNVAVEALTDARAPTGGTVGGVEANGGRSWRWQRIAAPIGDQGAMRIDVAVTDPEGSTIGHLTVIRPPAMAPRKPRVPPGQQPSPSGGRT
ncbi:MAG: type II secretion system minor pseudopilin GspI [Sphingomonas sp.]|nr:type II secretion system minor pseudopilin GspI [Sphingomonas sp.]